MVLYLTAAALDQGYHDRNPWFSTLLQQPLIKEIMIETLGSVLTAASLDQENHYRNPWFSTLLQHPSIKEQRNHDRNPWFNTLLQQPSIMEIMMKTLGSVPYCSKPRSWKS